MRNILIWMKFGFFAPELHFANKKFLCFIRKKFCWKYKICQLETRSAKPMLFMNKYSQSYCVREIRSFFMSKSKKYNLIKKVKENRTVTIKWMTQMRRDSATKWALQTGYGFHFTQTNTGFHCIYGLCLLVCQIFCVKKLSICLCRRYFGAVKGIWLAGVLYCKTSENIERCFLDDMSDKRTTI